MKGAKTALCNIKNVNLLLDSIKVLGVHYSYNKEVFQSKIFTSVIEKITKVLQVWNSRSLSLTGKIVVFKTLAISKIVLYFIYDICSRLHIYTSRKDSQRLYMEW